MPTKELFELRERLDELIEKGADAVKILEVSIELDRLIEEYMYNQGNKK